MIIDTFLAVLVALLAVAFLLVRGVRTLCGREQGCACPGASTGCAGTSDPTTRRVPRA